MEAPRQNTLASLKDIGLVIHPGRALRVCFVVPGFYHLLNPSVGGLFGGSEHRALMFARGLASKEGYEVSAVAFDYGQPKVEHYDGITVHRDDFHCLRDPAPKPSPPTLTPLRALLRRMRVGDILRAMHLRGPAPTPGSSEADVWATAGADIYCGFGVADFTARLADWCRSVGHPLVLFAGSDRDFSDEYQPSSTDTNVYGSRCGLCYDAVMRAHTIVVQTQTQARLLSSRFGRRGVVIANPIELDGAMDYQPTGERRFVLWIGKSNTVKCPDLVIDLARMCPTVPFKMVMNRHTPSVFEQVLAARPPNVEIIERVPPSEISVLYQEAFALLNTSPLEGFPNAFLEAGKYAVPVLSLTVDPDGLISRHNAGVVAGGDLFCLAEAIRDYHAYPIQARQAGQNLQEYVRHQHALPDRIADLDRLLQGLIRDGHPGRV